MGVFEYSNYKQFIRKHIASLPHRGRGEINRIAESIRVHPTFVSQVLNGDKDLTPEHAYHLSIYFGLPPLESDYLVLLVQLERAGTEEFKRYFRSKIDELKKNSLSVSKRFASHKSLDDQERSIFYSNWIYLYTWLLTSVGAGQSVETVSSKLSISRARASELLNFLKVARLCDEDDGLFKMKTQHVHLEFGSPYLCRHHVNWRMKAIQESEKLGEEELMFTSPISISKADFARVREELMKVIKTTSLIIRESPAEDIACLNLDLFWVKM